jgi:hypothetical protein
LAGSGYWFIYLLSIETLAKYLDLAAVAVSKMKFSATQIASGRMPPIAVLLPLHTVGQLQI